MYGRTAGPGRFGPAPAAQLPDDRAAQLRLGLVRQPPTDVPAARLPRPGRRDPLPHGLPYPGDGTQDLENTYDPDHLVALHGLEVNGSTTLRMLDNPSATADHGPPIAPEAWLGSELTWPSYSGWLGTITNLLGTNAKEFVLRVDGWPSGQRISYFADGRLQYRMLLATTPLGPNRTIQHISVALPRAATRWRDLRNYVLHRPEITLTSKQDIPLFNTIERGDRHGIYVGGDHGVLAFRKYYQRGRGRRERDSGAPNRPARLRRQRRAPARADRGGVRGRGRRLARPPAAGPGGSGRPLQRHPGRGRDGAAPG